LLVGVSYCRFVFPGGILSFLGCMFFCCWLELSLASGWSFVCVRVEFSFVFGLSCCVSGWSIVACVWFEFSVFGRSCFVSGWSLFAFWLERFCFRVESLLFLV
jgi:hypothetical protein